MNFFEATVRGRGASGLELLLTGDVPLTVAADDDTVAIGNQLTVGVRPQHLVLADEGMPIRIEQVEQLGSETIIHGESPALSHVVAARPDQIVAHVGETLHVDLARSRVVVFKSDGQRVRERPLG